MRTEEEIRALYRIYSIPFHKDTKSLPPMSQEAAGGVLDVLLWLLNPPERKGKFAVVGNAEELARCYAEDGMTEADLDRLSQEVWEETLSGPAQEELPIEMELRRLFGIPW